MAGRLKQVTFVACSEFAQWFIQKYAKATLGVDVEVDIGMTVVGDESHVNDDWYTLDINDRMDFAASSMELSMEMGRPTESAIEEVARRWCVDEAEVPLFIQILSEFVEESYP